MSTGSSSNVINSQVFYASQNRNALLGTAIVYLVHSGVSYPARAPIEPGLDASFITENLQKHLKLPTRSNSATVSCVNGSHMPLQKKLFTSN